MPLGPTAAMAGVCAGLAESLFVILPSESIKVWMIDTQRKKPQFLSQPRGRVRRTLHQMSTEYGSFKMFFRGFTPTIFRQVSYSLVSFWAYASFRQAVEGSLHPGERLGNLTYFVIGSSAGATAVLATMPFDVIKTKMQSTESKTEYNGMLKTIKCLSTGGLRYFWAGSIARLAHALITSGVQFSLYEQLKNIM